MEGRVDLECGRQSETDCDRGDDLLDHQGTNVFR